MENILLSNISLDDLATRLADRVSEIQTKRQQFLNPIQKQEEFLNIDQACEFLKLAKPTIYTLTCKKKIPFFKKGKKVLTCPNNI